MACNTWSVVDGQHFLPLCGNLLRRETHGPKGAAGGSCSICLGPKTQFGVCVDFVDPPAAYAYRISMTFDGNGFGGEVPNRGCGVLYRREFTVFTGEPCLWESEEVDMRCQSLGYSAFDPVICDTNRVSRKQVSLRLLRQTVHQTDRPVTANWPGGGLAAESSVTGQRQRPVGPPASSKRIRPKMGTGIRSMILLVSRTSPATAATHVLPETGILGDFTQLTVICTSLAIVAKTQQKRP
jgi:hypothetical protein